MGFLQKLLGEKAPDWAQPISMALYREFQLEVQRTVEKADLGAEFDWPNGNLLTNQGSSVVALENFLAKWMNCSPDERGTFVEDYVSSISETLDMQSLSIEDNTSLLKVRIYHAGSPEANVAACRPIGKFLVEALVLDGEKAVRVIDRDQLTQSGISEDEAFGMAHHNVHDKVPVKVERCRAPDGVLTVIQAPFYGATQIVLLDKYAEQGQRYWICTPSRDMMLMLQPHEEDPSALRNLLDLGQELWRTAGEHSILPFVLEYKDGVFRDLCVKVRDSIEIA